MNVFDWLVFLGGEGFLVLAGRRVLPTVWKMSADEAPQFSGWSAPERTYFRAAFRAGPTAFLTLAVGLLVLPLSAAQGTTIGAVAYNVVAAVTAVMFCVTGSVLVWSRPHWLVPPGLRRARVKGGNEPS